MKDNQWFKSSRCSQNECVEVARVENDGMLVRDSKNPVGPVLAFSSEEWNAFIRGAKLGEFDLT